MPTLRSVPRFRASLRQNRVRLVDEQPGSIGVDRSRALRPHRTYQVQPALQLLAELAGSRILGAPELADKAEVTKQRNPLFSLGSETAIGKPHEEVKGGGAG